MISLHNIPAANSAPLAVRVLVIGVGGAGGVMVEQLAAAGHIQAAFLAVDTDTQALQRHGLAAKLVVGEKLTRGLGCGGDAGLARRCIESSRKQLAKHLEGADVVLLLAGLGGGMGTGGAAALAEMAGEERALALAMVALPFDFEGLRAEQAQAGLEKLQAAADTVICFPNQLVIDLQREERSARETFQAANEIILQGVRAVGRLLRADGVINVGLADLRVSLKGRRTTSVLAHVEAGGETRHHDLLNKLLAQPVLESGQTLKMAEALVVSLVGGPELSATEIDRLAKQLSAHCPGAKLMLGAAVDDACQGRLSLTVIASRPLLPTPTTAAVSEPKHAGKNSAARQRTALVQQQQLALESVSKGRFEKAERTLHHGEDLDVPTYIRRNVALS